MMRTTGGISHWLCLLYASYALAQPPSPGSSPASDPASPARPRRRDASAATQAAEHFDRGVAFFNESRFDAALAEFDRAYELAPAYATLYNLARVHAALGHAVQAANAYERYLRATEGRLPAARREAIEQALGEQRSRIGQVLIAVDVAGAVINVDGDDIGDTPLLRPVALAAGTHTIEIRAPGYQMARRTVSVAGRETVRLQVSLLRIVERTGTLSIRTRPTHVRIAIDDRIVGVTPLSRTVPLAAGSHTVVAERTGYHSQTRTLVLTPRAHMDLAFELIPKTHAPPREVGRLRLHLPKDPSRVEIDGEMVTARDLTLPIGPHELRIEMMERLAYRAAFRIAADRTTHLTPPLEWRVEAHDRRLRAAESQRLAGQLLTVGGTLLAVASASVLLWNEAEINRTDQRVVDLNQMFEADCANNPSPPLRCEELVVATESLNGDQETQNVVRGVSLGLALGGVVLGAIGVGLWAEAPSEREIEEAARARLMLRPGLDRVSLALITP